MTRKRLPRRSVSRRLRATFPSTFQSPHHHPPRHRCPSCSCKLRRKGSTSSFRTRRTLRRHRTMSKGRRLDDDFLQALGDFANEHQAQGTQQAETPHALQQQPQQQHSTQSQQQQLQTQQPPPTPTHAQQQQQQPPQQHQQPQSQATSHPLTEPNTAMQLNFDFDQSFDFDVSSPSDVLPI
jgi:hypothetical protein